MLLLTLMLTKTKQNKKKKILPLYVFSKPQKSYFSGNMSASYYILLIIIYRDFASSWLNKLLFRFKENFTSLLVSQAHLSQFFFFILPYWDRIIAHIQYTFFFRISQKSFYNSSFIRSDIVYVVK